VVWALCLSQYRWKGTLGEHFMSITGSHENTNLKRLRTHSISVLLSDLSALLKQRGRHAFQKQTYTEQRSIDGSPANNPVHGPPVS
jgi:hypothetical protein